MLEYPGRIFFSRWEKPDEENGWLYGIAYRLALRAKEIYFNDSNNDPDWWDTWQVLELHGRENPRLHLVEYPHLAVHPFPEEKKRMVYYPTTNTLKSWDIKDPFILHYSHRLIPKELKGDPLTNPQDRKRWEELCENIYAKIENHAIIYHPGAHQKSTWNQLQKMKKIKIINLPNEEHPFRLQGWDVVEVDPEVGYADFGAL